MVKHDAVQAVIWHNFPPALAGATQATDRPMT